MISVRAGRSSEKKYENVETERNGVSVEATQLIYLNRCDEEGKYGEQEGKCCFCGLEQAGVPTSQAISQEYFSDTELIQSDTGHVCRFCAFCMDHRELKQGHWLVTEDEYVGFQSGEIFNKLRAVAEGEFSLPVAIHVSRNPIKAEHAYLWTPVMISSERLRVSYGKAQVAFRWPELEQIVELVEELRAAGFRLDDIRKGSPRQQDLMEVGLDRYREIESCLSRWRGSLVFELGLDASSSA